MVERWDRREKGETPEAFDALWKGNGDKQLEIDRLRSEVRKLTRELDNERSK